jgi:hypothetical protein
MAASTDAVKPRRRLTFPHKLFLRFLLSHFSIGAKVHGYYRLAGVTRESFFAQKKSADFQCLRMNTFRLPFLAAPFSASLSSVFVVTHFGAFHLFRFIHQR